MIDIRKTRETVLLQPCLKNTDSIFAPVRESELFFHYKHK